jgi:hypothetical protein
LIQQIGLSASSVTISCPPSTCFVGDCRCTISGCTGGFVYQYPTNECSGSATTWKSFSGSSFNLTGGAGTYYLSVQCSNDEISDCTGVTVTVPLTTTLLPGTTTTIATTSSAMTTTINLTSTTLITTTTITRDCSYNNPCPADCGKRKLDQSTNNQSYYEFFIDTVSNITVRLEPGQNVDYDLYVNWDGTKPEEDLYDCKPSKDVGEREECKKNTLFDGTYYIMVKYYQGSGNYNLSLSCTPMEPVTSTCADQNQPCKIDCGKSKLGMSTNAKNYFMFRLDSRSNVTVKMFPTSNVDYDLYVNWDGTNPSIDKYDCKSSSSKGENEVCSIPYLEAGDYYIMVDFYEGIGTYDLLLSCSVARISTTTTTIIATTAISTTSVNVSTTPKSTTSTTKTSKCGPNGYCEAIDGECTTGYEDCPDNDIDCETDQKCCCVAEIQPAPDNLWLVVGLIVILLMVVLVYFFIKSKSRITFEKLYRKWSR